jgi:tRNAThr (cytosine32-N3)-methyltransferase
VSESIEVEEGNGDGEDESEATVKDENLPGVPAPPTLPSLDPSFFASPDDPLHSPDDPSAHATDPPLRAPDALGLAHPLFTIKQLGVDRRLIVNRKRQLKMYRVWMQGKFQRTEVDALPLVSEPDKSHP